MKSGFLSILLALLCSGWPLALSGGESFKTPSGDSLRLGIKYVVYQDSKDQAVLNELEVKSSVEEINRVWGQCRIEFEIVEYLSVSPKQFGLREAPQDEAELTDIRNAFSDEGVLLVIATENWIRTGTLGNSRANAWTSMPGGPPYGVVLEKLVGAFANLLAHELGHYLGLLHVADQFGMMNPIVYNHSEFLSHEQCGIARRTAQSFWQKTIRE